MLFFTTPNCFIINITTNDKNNIIITSHKPIKTHSSPFNKTKLSICELTNIKQRNPNISKIYLLSKNLENNHLSNDL